MTNDHEADESRRQDGETKGTKTYVEMETPLEGPRIHPDADIYTMPWADGLSYVESLIGNLDIGEPMTIKFTLRELTDDEFQEICDGTP